MLAGVEGVLQDHGRYGIGEHYVGKIAHTMLMYQRQRLQKLLDAPPTPLVLLTVEKPEVG